MKVYGADTETFKLADGIAAPKLVCYSWDGDGDKDTGVVSADEGTELFFARLFDPAVVQIFHHIPFDLGVLAAEAAERYPGDLRYLRAIFQGIKDRRLRCTKIREQILENAKGELKFDWDEDLEQYKRSSFTLERCCWTRLRVFVEKKADTWRKSYGLLADTPVAWWPPDALKYALKDAALGRLLFFAQEEGAIAEECEVDEHGFAMIPGEMETTLTAFCLGLMQMWGVRTDPEATRVVRAEFQGKFDEAAAITRRWGLTSDVKKNGILRPKRNMKKIRDRVRYIYSTRGQPVPMTGPSKKFPHGQVCTDRETLTFKKYPSWEKDEALQGVANVVRYEKLLTTYVPILERGAEKPITPSWNAMVETFRTSCASPNLQNLPRGTSVRNCFVARPGRVFAFCDYDTLEMRTLAQSCLDIGVKYSVLAQAFREGKDPHVMMAADTLGIRYDDALARYEAGDPMIAGEMGARQYSKIANYGFGGGMGPDAFVDYARGYDIIVARSHAAKLREGYKRTWSEVNDYFTYCGMLCGEAGEAEVVVHPRTGYVRGRVGYTATCNHHFQHLAAVGAKAALTQVIEECYVVERSPLFGSRAWEFGHDEIGLEIPYGPGLERAASAAALRLQTIMIERMQEMCPDVPIGASVVMCRRWYKGAKPVNENGILVPSRPEKRDGKTVWVPDLELRRKAA